MRKEKNDPSQWLAKVTPPGTSALRISCVSDAARLLSPEKKPSPEEQYEVVSYILNNGVIGPGNDFHKLVQNLIELESVDYGSIVCASALELHKGNLLLLADAFQIAAIWPDEQFVQNCIKPVTETDPTQWTNELLLYRIIKWYITVINDAKEKDGEDFEKAIELCEQLRELDPSGEQSYYLESDLYRLVRNDINAIDLLRSAIFDSHSYNDESFKVRCPVCCWKLLCHYLLFKSDDYDLIKDISLYGSEYTKNANEREISEECGCSGKELCEFFDQAQEEATKAKNERKKHYEMLYDDANIKGFHRDEQYRTVDPILAGNVDTDVPMRLKDDELTSNKR